MTEKTPLSKMNKEDSLLNYIRENIIGHNTQIKTPFGMRTLTYADYTASGRSLRFIEDAIRHYVLPMYANTHTEANATGQQTTTFREQARQQIRDATNADESDLLLFCGSGATSAINTLITQLGLPRLKDNEKNNVCVLVGPYEHHSNELPWRELGVNVIRINEASTGGVCLIHLEQTLQNNQGKQLIGSFSAASNVTGILCQQDTITALLHHYKALAFWDFAAAAPYVNIDMNPVANSTARKDAIFFSTHKLVGGPGTPGVLIVKKQIIHNPLPSTVGGGTVSFVTPDSHAFLPLGERREEGGTPAIIESIRAGLVFQLKQTVGIKVIEKQERLWAEQIHRRWINNPAIERLGHPTAARLSITAFRIRTEFGYLHHGLITALLNDLFGIQVRGGCSCAGPYGHQLLGIDNERSLRIQDALNHGEKLVKPGWVRFNLNYFLHQTDVDFILDAIDFIAAHGLTLLPFYAYDNNNDLWHFQNKAIASPNLKDLFDLLPSHEAPLPPPAAKEDYFFAAKKVLEECLNLTYSPQKQAFQEQYNDIRDFVLVQDIC
ncbi:aminotransferase class V-fold PLP-dependent enzyme [Marinomonas pollencensis]|uniref:Selenocysteine lyase/cysteine desulfurase n=1 Tax=Marinomonas pollencensis TaxID=491954 RepID=A0A3E0DFI5_9GAMM|nr:aminotransferase class V-fold PLP-dependent enzyme [Marinomonas pollencensis]REG81313.1 selenocysteine lyase/cysteine desulfurase [Marinomonas pollencensis]